jgi:hypothetical protein
MKFILALVVVGLVGCANIGPAPMPIEQLEAIKLRDTDCKSIDANVDLLEQQLRLKGILGKNPEDLSQEDRRYNSTVRIMIWSLRIGCNNPNRYSYLDWYIR